MNERSGSDHPDVSDASDSPDAPEPRRVLARPEPGETAEEFSARLLTAILDDQRSQVQPPSDDG